MSSEFTCLGVAASADPGELMQTQLIHCHFQIRDSKTSSE